MHDGSQTFHAVTTWRVLRQVAEGGMSEIHLAEQSVVGGAARIVGLKRLKRHLCEQPLYRELFASEARLVAQLPHDHIQQVFGLVEWDGAPTLVTEWVDGINLEELNTRLDAMNAYLPPNLALLVVARVAAALAWAHGRRGAHGEMLEVVHCDISPVNILLGWHGAIKLADFGIARAHGRAASRLPADILGKSPYLAPEQAVGGPIDTRTDVFALGLVLFELLTGQQVFPAQNVDETRDLHARWELVSPREWNPSISNDVEAILMRMLARDPAERFADCAQVAAAIEQLLNRFARGPDATRLALYLSGIFPEIDRSAPHGVVQGV